MWFPFLQWKWTKSIDLGNDANFANHKLGKKSDHLAFPIYDFKGQITCLTFSSHISSTISLPPFCLKATTKPRARAFLYLL